MVYYLVMASIVGKRQGNQTYYYLVESARVDGKPRIVAQQDLGSSVEVMAKLAGSAAVAPVRTQHSSRGHTDPASLRSIRRWPSFTMTWPSLSRIANSRR